MWLEGIGESNEVLFYMFVVVCAINLVLAVEGLIAGSCTSLRIPGMSIDLYICLGSIPWMVTVLARGVHIDWLNNPQADLDMICQLYPSFLCFGLLWVVGGLLVKAVANFTFYGSNMPHDMPRYEEWRPNFFMFFLILVDAAAAISWIILHPIKAVVFQDVGVCVGEYMDEWQMGISIFHGFLLLLAGIIVVPALGRTDQGIKSITLLLLVMIYNLIFLALAASIVWFIYGDQLGPKKSYVVNGAIILYGLYVTLVLVFVSKILAVVYVGVDVEEKEHRSSRTEIDHL